MTTKPSVDEARNAKIDAIRSLMMGSYELGQRHCLEELRESIRSIVSATDIPAIPATDILQLIVAMLRHLPPAKTATQLVEEYGPHV